jgi:SAM-dependent methyltransferase
MSHLEQVGFFAAVAEANAALVAGAAVLEVGSYDVNGSIRSVYSAAAKYVGVDLDHGPGVDVVAYGHQLDHPEGSYDVTLSGECFEHDPHWRKTFLNMVRMTRPGGLVAFTCASRGRAEHGTVRSDKTLSPGTQSAGLDYYRNLEERDFRDLPLDDVFSEYKFWYLPTHFDLFFAGVRRGGDHRARLPNDATVAALSALMPWPYKTVMAPFRGLVKILPERHYQTVALPMWKALMPIIARLERRRATAI